MHKIAKVQLLLSTRVVSITRGLIIWEGCTRRKAPGGSLTLQCSVLLLAPCSAGMEDGIGAKWILVLFTPAAPPSSPLMAGSKPLSPLLGAAGTDKMSHFLIPKGRRSQAVNTVGSVEGQGRGCYVLHSLLCSPLISIELPLYDVGLFFFLNVCNI